MARIKDQKLRKLKRVYMGGSIFSFIIVSILTTLALAAMIISFFYYMVSSKLSSESDRISRLAALYELSSARDNSDIAGLLDRERNVYIIVDKDDNVIKEHGENTCDLESGKKLDSFRIEQEIEGEGTLVISGLDRDLQIYPDKERRFVESRGGKISIDFAGVRQWISEGHYEVLNNFEDGTGDIELPFWIPVTLSNGDRLIGKASFVLYVRDIIVMGFLTLAIVLLMLAVLVIMLTNSHKIHKSRKRMNEVFYMDEVTGKHNWMWFLTNAEQILKKKKNAFTKFAVLDIVFVNYRNFCVCHSVEEGEKMLIKVDELIQSRLEKNELIAHYASANFAAMLKYSDRDALEERVKSIVKELEHIDDGHKFSFHVGIYRIRHT